MKKKLQFLLIPFLALMIAACQKDKVKEESQPEPKPVAVNFNVSGFSVTHAAINTSGHKETNGTRTDGSPVYSNDKLIYVIYDNAGGEVSRLTQQVSDAGNLYRIRNDQKILIKTNNTYGALADTLIPGTYTVIVTQGPSNASWNKPDEGLSRTASEGYYPRYALSTATYYPSSSSTLGDSFYYKGTLTVGANPATQNITLDRLVGQLTFSIDDAIPAGAATLSYDILSDNLFFKVSNNTPGGTRGDSNGHLTGSITIDATDIGKLNYQKSIYVLNTATPMTVKLSVLDAQGSVLATKTISNVTVSRNQQTTLKGKLFDGIGPTGFVVAVNQAWGSNPTTINIPPASNTNAVTIGSASYPVVKIGNLLWTAQNYGGPGGVASQHSISGIGNLYTHDQAAAVSLPSGWRLPTKAELESLLQLSGAGLDVNGQLYAQAVSTIKLKSSSAYWLTPGNNALGFAALPAGIRYVDDYATLYDQTMFWSSTTGPNAVSSDPAWFALTFANYNSTGGPSGEVKLNDFAAMQSCSNKFYGSLRFVKEI